MAFVERRQCGPRGFYILSVFFLAVPTGNKPGARLLLLKLEWGDHRDIFCRGYTHFYRENVMEYERRPFQSVDEMNEVLIQNWNAKVSDNDDIYIKAWYNQRNREDNLRRLDVGVDANGMAPVSIMAFWDEETVYQAYLGDRSGSFEDSEREGWLEKAKRAIAGYYRDREQSDEAADERTLTDIF